MLVCAVGEDVEDVMHIADVQQPQPTTTIQQTKCARMTEEGHRRHGMNGTADGPKTALGQGGRLKFFKDGKFILELERAREGERVSWVSVPRKTFWPPQGTAASTPSYRQESSTSLSVSDDNSSIQSSPWQRDHSWKQTTPRQNISKELCFFFWRPKSQRLPRKTALKHRKPYSAIALDNDTPKKPNKREKIRLLAIIQSLLDKTSRTSTPPRSEMVVSPRKRFLREMEKDKPLLEETNCQKRSRNKAGNSQVSPSPIRVQEKQETNGNEEAPKPRNCSYSITSLLADDHSSANKRSPNLPEHYRSPNSEDRWYSESVDRLRSIELSQVEKRGIYPVGYHQQPFIPAYLHSYQYAVPPYFGAGVYGRSPYVVPPVYHSPLPLPGVVRQEAPSCSWAAEPPPRDLDNREDTIGDMPLNLSKHAG